MGFESHEYPFQIPETQVKVTTWKHHGTSLKKLTMISLLISTVLCGPAPTYNAIADSGESYSASLGSGKVLSEALDLKSYIGTTTTYI